MSTQGTNARETSAVNIRRISGQALDPSKPLPGDDWSTWDESAESQTRWTTAPEPKSITLDERKIDRICDHLDAVGNLFKGDLMQLVDGLKYELTVDTGHKLDTAIRLLAEFYADCTRAAIMQDADDIVAAIADDESEERPITAVVVVSRDETWTPSGPNDMPPDLSAVDCKSPEMAQALAYGFNERNPDRDEFIAFAVCRLENRSTILDETPSSAVIIMKKTSDLPAYAERHNQTSPELATEFAVAFNEAELATPKGVWAVPIHQVPRSEKQSVETTEAETVVGIA